MKPGREGHYPALLAFMLVYDDEALSSSRPTAWAGWIIPDQTSMLYIDLSKAATPSC
jgi:hypothetical protein